MTYTAEVYYTSVNGQPKSRKYPQFDARNDNHAIRRIVKTADHSIPAMHFRINVWKEDRGVAHICCGKVYGAGHVTVNDVKYDPSDWVEHFPG